MAKTTRLPILHFNDVYRVTQTSRAMGGTITADQFAAKISALRGAWGEESRSLDFLVAQDGQEKRRKDQQPLLGLVLFSGDVFNPSIESSVTRGEHMVDVLNACSIDCACLGNHDFDFGYPHLQRLMQQTNFPWTFSNIADVGGDGGAQEGNSDEPLASDKQVEGTLRSWVCEVQGIRIGCIGLVEKDWIATVPAFPPSFRYRSMVSMARKLSMELRDPAGEHRCDLVVALTHCRLPNDIDLANDLGATKDAASSEHGVDIVLGGHDHTYYIGNGVDTYEGEDWQTDLPGKEKDKSCLLVKSGTDFHDLSEIELQVSDPVEGVARRRRIVAVKVRRHSTLPSDPTLPELKEHIDELMERVDKATGQPVAFTLTPLDCRMAQVRTEESATGNLVADILMHSYEDALRERDRRGELLPSRPEDEREVDMALICGGSLRGDAVFGPGTITLRDILSIMPFEDAVVVKELTGQDIWHALENGFGAYPSQEGRFPQVAGLSIKWDSRRPPGQRLVEVRLLEDVHLFHPDGRRKEENEMEAAERTSYAFQRSLEGGYSIEVNRPKIRRGRKLEMDRLYRVCTREYMAEGHDGYEALSRGGDVIDHESGSLMSTQVRKFLLGASLIWRLKSFRENSDESGKGVVGHDMLSSKTRRAIERANALGKADDADGPPEDTEADSRTNGQSAATQTPRKGRVPAPLSGLDVSPRVVIDSSPGGIRDAIHVGASEHHSRYDAASKLFKSTTPREPKTALSPRKAPLDVDSPAQSPSRGTSAQSSRLPLSAPPLQHYHGLSPRSSSTKEGTSVLSRHLEVSPEDAEELRHAEADLAVIAPLKDGRMVDVARAA